MQRSRDRNDSENGSVIEVPSVEERQQSSQQARALPRSRPTSVRFDDPEVIAKMKQFHDDLTGLQLQKCSICLEQFPCMSISDKHIYHDKHPVNYMIVILVLP